MRSGSINASATTATSKSKSGVDVGKSKSGALAEPTPLPEDEGPKLPPGFMYKVICFYKYKPEEDDELCLQVGDVINVVEYDRPEDEVSI